MKKSFFKFQLVGFIVTVLCGVLLHFLYEWSGQSILVAPISAINESTWEHMKLLFIPMFLFAIVQSFYFKDRNDFWDIKIRGIILGLILIPVLFYTFNGVIGKSPDWINIMIFVVSGAISYLYELKLYKKKDRRKYISKENAIILLCFIASLFILFTFYPLDLAIFKELNDKR